MTSIPSDVHVQSGCKTRGHSLSTSLASFSKAVLAEGLEEASRTSRWLARTFFGTNALIYLDKTFANGAAPAGLSGTRDTHSIAAASTPGPDFVGHRDIVTVTETPAAPSMSCSAAVSSGLRYPSDSNNVRPPLNSASLLVSLEDGWARGSLPRGPVSQPLIFTWVCAASLVFIWIYMAAQQGLYMLHYDCDGLYQPFPAGCFAAGSSLSPSPSSIDIDYSRIGPTTLSWWLFGPPPPEFSTFDVQLLILWVRSRLGAQEVSL